MRRERCSCGYLPALFSVCGVLGGMIGCAQAPAFSEQVLANAEYKADGSAGDEMGMPRCAALTPEHSECRAAQKISRTSSADSVGVGNETGSSDGGASDATSSDGFSSGSPSASDNSGANSSDGTASESPVIPSPTPDPVVVVTPGPVSDPVSTPVPTPVVTPVPTPATTPVPVSQPKPGAIHEQIVQQPDQGKVDILWVIDNSGSMSWAQRELGDKFENFARELQNAGVDFRVGVTTTDACSPDGLKDEFCPEGSIRGARGNLVANSSDGPKYLTNSSANLLDSFRTLALRGTSGSGLEQGLSAAKFAVEKSAQGRENDGFLRSNVPLSVIVLSDEEDDGVGMWNENAYGELFPDYFGNKAYPLDSYYAARYNFANQRMTVDKFRQQMDVLKGNGNYQVNAITGIKNAAGNTYCRLNSDGTPFGPMEAGTNYIRAAQETGGRAENICGQWTSILSNLGRVAVELTTRITLESEPFSGTLEVFVGGELWVSGYEYDSASRTIVFKTLPPYGAQVLVRYREIVR